MQPSGQLFWKNFAISNYADRHGSFDYGLKYIAIQSDLLETVEQHDKYLFSYPQPGWTLKLRV